MLTKTSALLVSCIKISYLILPLFLKLLSDVKLFECDPFLSTYIGLSRILVTTGFSRSFWRNVNFGSLRFGPTANFSLMKPNSEGTR